MPSTPPTPSRRTFLALGSVVLAGCTSAPGTTTDDTGTVPTNRPTTASPPSTAPETTDEPGTTEDDAGTTEEDADEDREPPSGPTVAWTVDVGNPVATGPVLAPGGETLYVAAGAFDRDERPRDAREEDAARDVVAVDADGTERSRYAAGADVVDLAPTDAGVYAAVGWPTWPEGSDFRVERIVDGERSWSRGGDRKAISLCGVTSDGGVVGGTRDDALGRSGETLFAYGPDGARRFSVESGDVYRSGIADGEVYLSFGEVLCRCVDARTGETRWEHPGEFLADGAGDLGAPAIDDDGIAYADTDESNDAGDYPLVALDTADGTERWRYTAEIEGRGNYVPVNATAGDGVAFVCDYSGVVSAIDTTGGDEIWRASVADRFGAGPVVLDDRVCLTDQANRLYALEVDSGEIAWTRDVAAGWSRLAQHAGGVTVITPRNGSVDVERFAPNGTPAWAFEHDTPANGFAVDDETVYYGSENGYLVALRP